MTTGGGDPVANGSTGRCIFCWDQGPLTKEHPLSKRVLDLAGFELGDTHIEIDPSVPLTLEYVEKHARTIGDEFVVCACRRCNNGWMQNLDGSFAGTVQRWAEEPDHRLGETGLAVIRRFMLKVLWVKALGEVWAHGPIVDNEIRSPFILNPTDGTRIMNNDLDEIADHISLAAATISPEAIFTTAFFMPTILGGHRTAGVHRFSAGMVVALPRLRTQLWLVHRLNSEWRTIWPDHVSWIAPGTRWRNLKAGSDQPMIDAVHLATGEVGGQST